MRGDTLNPGSFNAFREKLDSDIPTHEAVNLYTKALAAYREAVTDDPLPTRPASDFTPRTVEEMEFTGEAVFEPLVEPK